MVPLVSGHIVTPRGPVKKLTDWLTQPFPSPRFAVCGSPRWMPKHSVELYRATQLQYTIVEVIWYVQSNCPSVMDDPLIREDARWAQSGYNYLQRMSSFITAGMKVILTLSGSPSPYPAMKLWWLMSLTRTKVRGTVVKHGSLTKRRVIVALHLLEC